MKKGRVLLIVSLITYTFSSCKYYDPEHESGQDDNIYNTEIYNEIGKERWDWDDSAGDECALKVIDCFINKDSETLKEMFCNRVRNSADLDEQIDEAFEFIKGNIISYDDYIASCDEVAYDEGKVVERYYGPFVDNITTDNNKVYTMNISLYTVYEKDNEYVGVDAIVICESNGDKIMLGMVP